MTYGENIGFYKKPVSNTTQNSIRNIESIIQEIKTSRELKSVCSKIRDIKDPDPKKQKKLRNAIKEKELPYMTPHGICQPSRKDENFKDHSGILIFDIDDLATDEVTTIKSKLIEDPYLAFAFVSPGGNGLKFGAFTNAVDKQSHDLAWQSQAKYFHDTHAIKIDPAPKAISNACFLSSDPAAYFNPKAKVFTGGNGKAPQTEPGEKTLPEGLEHLHPVDKGIYYKLDCPKCGKPDAYMYKDGSWIHCSHKDTCDYFEFFPGVDRPWFDKKHHFIPAPMASYFLKNERFVFDRGELHYYDITSGIFRQGGESAIKGKVQLILGDDYKDSYGCEVFKQIETVLRLQSPKLDQGKNLIVLKNGCLDWRTGELLPHSPDFLSSILIPLVYDPGATCPKTDKFFMDVLESDCLELVYELFGYLLIPSMIAKKCILLHGKADGGKSKFIDLIRSYIGEKNVSPISLQELAENKFRAAGLAGKLANCFPDLNNQPLKFTGLFKALVSGDCVQVESKGKDPFDLYNKARFIFSANEIPRSYDQTDSFYIRWIILRFPNSFPPGSPKRDPHIIEKLTTDAELSGLLNKALAGLRVFMDAGDFAIPETAKLELENYRGENENIRVFLETQCTVNDEYQISKSDLYRHYEDYCKARQFSKFSQGRFNGEIIKFNEQIYESRRKIGTSYVRVWEGLNLTVEAQKKPFGSNSDE